MGTAPALPFVSVEDYLRTEYEPYCEYVDGELKPKRMPGDDHSSLMKAIIAALLPRERSLSLRVRPERHIRINPSRYRIPDLAVFTERDPQRAATIAPLVTIEIVSPDETWSELNDKIRDHLSMGVATVIIADPRAQTVFVARPDQPLHQLAAPLHVSIEVPERGTLDLDFQQIFADMD